MTVMILVVNVIILIKFEKEEILIPLIPINILILCALLFVRHDVSNQNPIEFDKLSKEYNITISRDEFNKTGEKLKTFCKNYYSTTDSKFCEDGKLNEHTYNVVFENMYGKTQDTRGDVVKATEFMRNTKQ